jgi:hypothetical protein
LNYQEGTGKIHEGWQRGQVREEVERELSLGSDLLAPDAASQDLLPWSDNQLDSPQ